MFSETTPDVLSSACVKIRFVSIYVCMYFEGWFWVRGCGVHGSFCFYVRPPAAIEINSLTSDSFCGEAHRREVFPRMCST